MTDFDDDDTTPDASPPVCGVCVDCGTTATTVCEWCDGPVCADCVDADLCRDCAVTYDAAGDGDCGGCDVCNGTDQRALAAAWNAR